MSAENINMRCIPSTNEKIPNIGLGTWQVFDRAKEPDKLLARFHQLGGRMIDTSPMYGNSEQYIGNITSNLKINATMFIATKVWASGKMEGQSQIARSFKLLQRHQIDLIQIHNLLDWRAHLPTLQRLKEDGKLRYIGLTHYSDHAHAELERIMTTNKVDFIQVNYSLSDRNAAAMLLPQAHSAGVSVIINRPFDGGQLLRKLKGRPFPMWLEEIGCESWEQCLLKFVLSQPAVMFVIPATSNIEHLNRNMQAMDGALFDENLQRKLIKYIESL